MIAQKQIQDIANILRRDSLISTTEADSGHPTSCLSSAEIMACLFFSHMKYDPKDPNNPDNDEFILSKGHASPILYSALYRANCIKTDLKTLRKLNSTLEGHPIARSLKWAKVSTGSLGQGLSIGIGFALAAKLQKRKYKTYVLIGDSETAEGSIYEAIQLAPHYKLNNLIAIIDANRLGEQSETILGHNIEEYKKIFLSFGWTAITIDGHNIAQILAALKKSKDSKKPTAIIAKTFKGKGVSFLENKLGWHSEVLSKKQLEKALKQIPNPEMPKISPTKPKKLIRRRRNKFKKTKPKFTSYNLGWHITTRRGFGQTLASLGKSDNSVIAVDSEVGDATHTDELKKAKPKQFIQAYIAEQNMISIALGLSKKGYNVFAGSFSSFLSRAHDQIRMAAISSADLTITGAHSGVATGEDGAPQMGLEDIAIFRDLPNSSLFYPSDAVSAQKLTQLAYKSKGIKYIRTTRPKLPVIYENSEKFPIGDFKILKKSSKDKCVLIGSGITLHESLKAHALLKKTKTAVIDLYCIKPFNSKKLIQFVKRHGNKIVITEDHFKAGGIGEMLATELKNTGIKISHLYVKGIPHSGPYTQLLDKYKINYKAIVNATKKLI